MTPKFWKLSQGTDYFTPSEMIRSVYDRLVYVHKDTKAKGRTNTPQGEAFKDAPIGDYFYLTNGNEGVYLLGQFTGPANLFSQKGKGWLDRPFRMVKPTNDWSYYDGEDKWWAPNNNSTFISVPSDELPLFEEEILQPYFELSLKDFRV